jgi:hypothetical protein
LSVVRWLVERFGHEMNGTGPAHLAVGRPEPRRLYRPMDLPGLHVT